MRDEWRAPRALAIWGLTAGPSPFDSHTPDVEVKLRTMAGPFCLVQPRFAIVTRNKPTTGHSQSGFGILRLEY